MKERYGGLNKAKINRIKILKTNRNRRREKHYRNLIINSYQISLTSKFKKN